MNPRSVAAWEKFRSKVEEFGGQVIEPEWLGMNVPHRVICKEGHESTPHPGSIHMGRGICRTCSGLDPRVTEARFRGLVKELGGQMVDAPWSGLRGHQPVICADGHQVSPSVASVLRGRGICRVCAGKDPTAAWAAFRRRVDEMGGQMLEPRWLGCQTQHRVICKAGHECTPLPNGVQQGYGLCATCAGNDTRVAEVAFRSRIAEMGAVIVEPEWRGSSQPHHVICAQGHDCHPRPNDIQGGSGICRACVRALWDTFYVVTNDALGRVKFGVTASDARIRLGAHRRNGYGSVVRTMEGLPSAPVLERSVLATLRLAGIPPIQGREYFDVAAIPVILDVADHWIPSPRKPVD